MNAFNLYALIFTFGIIFISELGDKTQIMVITLAAKSNNPLKIGIGSSIGITLTVIIGVIIGFVFSIFINPFWVKIVGAIIFNLFGIISLLNLYKKYYKYTNSPENITLNNNKNEIDDPGKNENKRNEFIFALINVFIVEFGDKTQLMTITLAASYNAPIEVGLGASFALCSLCLLGAYLGGLISKKIPKKWIALATSLLFIFLGMLLFFEAFYSL
ncbi:MAG: TMEM165/GDT1 family protein [Candidatus Helarchaeota archaeon]